MWSQAYVHRPVRRVQVLYEVRTILIIPYASHAT